MCTFIYTCIYIHIYICACVHIYIYMHEYMCIPTCVKMFITRHIECKGRYVKSRRYHEDGIEGLYTSQEFDCACRRLHYEWPSLES